jgi:hypothetical protein
MDPHDLDAARANVHTNLRAIGLADDPNLTDPRQLPELRMELLARWQPGHPYETLAAHVEGEVDTAGNSLPYNPRFDRRALAAAELWWVTPDMCRLVVHAVSTLPSATLTEDLLPAEAGLVYFAEPLTGTDSAATGIPINIRFMLWGVNLIRRDGPAVPDQLEPLMDYYERRPALTIAAYGHPFGADSGAYLPHGKSDWLIGTHWDTKTADWLTDEQHRSMTEERRWLAALWLLASQPLGQTSSQSTPRHARRRLQRAFPEAPGRLHGPEVRLVDVRRTSPPQAPGEPGERTGRRWGHRTIVTGHWRQQAYGPGRSQRRPTWIEEHIAGPDDRPLVLREDVHVVRASPDEVQPPK